MPRKPVSTPTSEPIPTPVPTAVSAPDEPISTPTAGLSFAPITTPGPPLLLLLDPYEIEAPDELNTRRFQTSRDSILSLAQSILSDGQQVPVGVTQLPDSRYLLKYGWRRWQAACLIIEESLWQDVLSEPPKLLALVTPSTHPLKGQPHPDLIAGIVENAQRENLGPVDQAYAIKLLADSGMRQRAIAAHLGLNQTQVSTRLRLLELPAETQRLVNSGHISIDVALSALSQPAGPRRDAAIEVAQSIPTPAPSVDSDTDVRIDSNCINADTEVLNEPAREEPEKRVNSKTAKKMLAELYEYATPDDYDPKKGRTPAQMWVLTKLVPWINKTGKSFQSAMTALEKLNK